MASRILSTTPVPVDTQSVLPRAVGVPWWGAVLIAAGFTVVGAIIDVQVNSALGLVYNSFFLVGSVLAVLAVRRRALFTAAVQPPLVTLSIGLIALYSMVLSSSDAAAPQGMRQAILEVVLPFSNLFPWIIGTFVLCVLIAAARWFTTRDAVAAEAAEPQTRRQQPAPRAKQVPRKKQAPREKSQAPGERRVRPAAERPTPAAPAPAKGKKPAASDAKPRTPARPARTTPAAARSAVADGPRVVTESPGTERPGTQPAATERRPGPTTRPATEARPAERSAAGGARPVRRDPSVVGQGDRPVRRAQPQVIPASPDGPRRTAGQLRDTGAIEDLTTGLDD